AGTYTTIQSVTIAQAQSLAVCYTTDGSTPTSSGGSCTHGTLYSAPVTVAVSEVLKAIGINSGWTDSAVGSAAYTINLAPASTPTCSPTGGTFTTGQSVSCSTTSPSAILCYDFTGSSALSTNGSTGCSAGTLYSGPISIAVGETLYVVAGGTGYTDSAVAQY